MTDTDTHKIRTALGSMVAEAPEPVEFDQLGVIRVGDPSPSRRQPPVLVVAAAFAAVLVAVGGVALFTNQIGSSAADGESTIYLVPTDMPDDLALRVGEVWDDGNGTTQIYAQADAEHFSEDIRTATINVADPIAVAQANGETVGDGYVPMSSAELFASLRQSLVAVYGADNLTFDEIEIRDRHSLVIERTTVTNDGGSTTNVGVVVAEGDSILSETDTQNLTRSEAIDIARSLRPVSTSKFPELVWPAIQPPPGN